MGQFNKVLLAIDKFNLEPQQDLDSRPVLGGLSPVYGPNCPTPSVNNSCNKTWPYLWGRYVLIKYIYSCIGNGLLWNNSYHKTMI